MISLQAGMVVVSIAVPTSSVVLVEYLLHSILATALIHYLGILPRVCLILAAYILAWDILNRGWKTHLFGCLPRN